ncbi:MAG: hypothetical protein RI903_222, partial [Bacteroidota bacterium]
MKCDFAVIVPMANEEKEFSVFVGQLSEVLTKLGAGKVYFIVDQVSKDNTRTLCAELSEKDARFQLVWAPENKNVVDAYIKGYQ